MLKHIVVIYHANCPDGLSGAWAARKRFGASATYLPLQHQIKPTIPKGLTGKEIYFIDILLPLPLLTRVVQANERVVAIEHHRTRMRETRSLREHVFALDHSGGTLAWRYFHPKRPIPRLLRYIEDMDLWRFRLPRSREITTALELTPLSFTAWDKVAHDLGSPAGLREYAARGATILSFKKALAARIAAQAREAKLGKTRVWVVNAPFFESEVGNMILAQGARIALVWAEHNKHIKVSLRSKGNVDVASLAERYGGGGHTNAAGFRIRRGGRFPWRDMRPSKPKQ